MTDQLALPLPAPAPTRAVDGRSPYSAAEVKAYCAALAAETRRLGRLPSQSEQSEIVRETARAMREAGA